MEHNRPIERTISFNDKSFSIYLSSNFMKQLEEIAYLEDLSVNELCYIVHTTHPYSELSEAIKSFLSIYYRNLALELPAAYSAESRLKLKKLI